MKILVFGKTGNLSRALSSLLSINPLVEFAQLGKDELNFLYPEKISEILSGINPDIIINAAAYTSVDLAEENRDSAFKINADAPFEIAKWCKLKNKILVHYSTDYVFDGFSQELWTEESVTTPINIYGKSKLAGEQAIINSGCNHFIFRTSWIFAPHGANFFQTMLKLGAEKEVLKIVNDQWGAPTYAYTIAETTLKILTAVSNQENKHFGVYHLCDNNFTTWYHFACKIFELYRKSGRNLLLKEVIPISSEEFKSKAIRPKNSKMSTLKIQQTFGVHFLEWEKTLQNCMDIYLENTKN